MKTIIFAILLMTIQSAIAQKIAYIESEKILEKMPEYQKANSEIDKMIKEWQTELDSKFNEIEALYQEYVKTESLLSIETRKQKQEQIIDMEKQAKDFREQKFGKDGDLARVQEEKLKPLHETITSIVDKIAKELGYDYVFEKSGDSNWIYTNPQLNITESVIMELGL